MSRNNNSKDNSMNRNGNGVRIDVDRGFREGFRVADGPVHRGIQQPLIVGGVSIDRHRSGFVPSGISDDMFDDRAITLAECDDVIANLYVMSDFDVQRMMDLLVCSMAVFIRDSIDDPCIRGMIKQSLISKVRRTYTQYDALLGDGFHDFRESLREIPVEVLLGMAFGDDDFEDIPFPFEDPEELPDDFDADGSIAESLYDRGGE